MGLGSTQPKRCTMSQTLLKFSCTHLSVAFMLKLGQLSTAETVHNDLGLQRPAELLLHSQLGRTSCSQTSAIARTDFSAYTASLQPTKLV